MPSRTTRAEDRRRAKSGVRKQPRPSRDAIDADQLLTFVNALKEGDFSVRMPPDWTGIAGEIAGALNDVARRGEWMANELRSFGAEVARAGAVEVVPESRREADPLLTGRKILIVDDDGRSIFALTTVLEREKMEVVHAESGAAALATLESAPGIDAVLMDIMMPEMDGFQTMRIIRRMEKFRALPIIALTARAMDGDREQCIRAGASDYIAKPVDIEQLFTVLRVWLYR